MAEDTGCAILYIERYGISPATRDGRHLEPLWICHASPIVAVGFPLGGPHDCERTGIGTEQHTHWSSCPGEE